MAKIVSLPANFSLSALKRFTREIVGPGSVPLDDAFVFDFSALNFIDGTGYTVLSNTLAWLCNQDVGCTYVGYTNLSRPGIAYLDDCGFFETYTGHKLHPDSRPRANTIPCTAVANANAFGWLEYSLSPWMSDVLKVSHGALGSVRTCVKELFHNINDHSTLDTGFVHVQHYPGLRAVRITVSDFGTGIPTTIRSRFGDMSDGKAVLQASQEGVTAKSRPNNMGAGLCYLVDCVTANQGTVSIHSLSGSLYCFRGRGGLPERRAETGNGTYPGTLVDITLDTRLFVGDEEERGQLEW